MFIEKEKVDIENGSLLKGVKVNYPYCGVENEPDAFRCKNEDCFLYYFLTQKEILFFLIMEKNIVHLVLKNM